MKSKYILLLLKWKQELCDPLRKVSSYSGNVTKKKKKKILSKYVWACSYFFFFFFSLVCYIPLFIFFSFFSSFISSCLLKIITGVILKFLIQGFVIWFYHLYNKNNADQEFITNFRIGIMPCRWHVFISYNHIRGCCSELDLVFKWRAILKRKLNCTIMYVFCLSFTC